LRGSGTSTAAAVPADSTSGVLLSVMSPCYTPLSPANWMACMTEGAMMPKPLAFVLLCLRDLLQLAQRSCDLQAHRCLRQTALICVSIHQDQPQAVESYSRVGTPQVAPRYPPAMYALPPSCFMGVRHRDMHIRLVVQLVLELATLDSTMANP
jgi:hypothetical protein